MIDKNKIIEILEKHPNGLKVKDIAVYISGTDRKTINQILYSNKDCFCVKDYVWTLVKVQASTSSLSNVDDKIKAERITEFEKIITNLYKETIHLTDSSQKMLSSLSNESFLLIKKNIKAIAKERHIPKLQWATRSEQLEKLIHLCIFNEFTIDSIIERSNKIFEIKDSITFYFDVWYEIVTAENQKFNNYMLYAKKIRPLLLPDLFDCEHWLELIFQLSSNKTFPILSQRSKDINDLKFYIHNLEKYDNWKQVIDLDNTTYKTVIASFNTLKRLKLFKGATYCENLVLEKLSFAELLKICSFSRNQFEETIERIKKLSEKMKCKSITFEWLIEYEKNRTIFKSNDFSLYLFLINDFEKLDQLCEEYREYICQNNHFLREEQRKKEITFREKEKMLAIKNGPYQNLEIGRACTGNCSTCDREECVENKR